MDIKDSTEQAVALGRALGDTFGLHWKSALSSRAVQQLAETVGDNVLGSGARAYLPGLLKAVRVVAECLPHQIERGVVALERIATALEAAGGANSSPL